MIRKIYEYLMVSVVGILIATKRLFLHYFPCVGTIVMFISTLYICGKIEQPNFRTDSIKSYVFFVIAMVGLTLLYLWLRAKEEIKSNNERK